MESYKTKKIEYSASPSSADGYDAIVLIGSSVGDAIIPYLPVSNSWGRGSKVWAVGEDTHIAPDTVYIRYYSLVDDKFYVAKHLLDQQEMYRLLTTKYKDRKGEKLSYTSFDVSVAPRGLVGVWISGSAGYLEVCQFRAQEAELDFAEEYKYVFGITGERSNFLEHRKSLFPFIQKEIAENRVSSVYWERLSKKYRWKLTTNDPGFEVYDYNFYLINQEAFYQPVSGNWLTESNEKAIPKKFTIDIKHDKDPLRYRVTIELVKPGDPNDSVEKRMLTYMNRNRELMDLFDRFYAQVGNEEVSLVVEFDDSMKSAIMKLKTATKEREIEDCILRGIYDSDQVNMDD